MEIVSRLSIDGNANAVLIEDGEVKYPVFMESLHTKALFDQLVQSGYRLCGLPYDFKKDGFEVMSLPVVEYAPTQEEFQEMFDMNDLEKYRQDELRTKLSVDDIQYIQQPPAEYTINTREEFLKYLRGLQTITVDNDFLPINYFVHPAARFTIEEWRSGEFHEYFNIMESRRCMPYWKFKRLRDWLISIGMPEDGDAVDIVEYYCMWGIDGLNTRFVSSKRKTMLIDEEFIQAPGMEADAYELVRIEDALVDRYGAIFAPEDIQPGYNGWVVSGNRGKESSAFRDKISKLNDGEFDVVQVRTKTQEDVLYYEGLRDTFKVTPQQIIHGNKVMTNLRVYMPDITAASLAPYWWSKKYDGRVREMSNIRAIAKMIIDQRKFTADVSSYKALMEVGCDAKGALMYIIDKIKESVSEDDEDGGANEIPTEYEVNLFLSGESEEEMSLNAIQQVRYDTVKDIVDGVVNIDGVRSGKSADESFTVDTVYKYLYCAHFCRTHIPVAEMYEKFRNISATIEDRRDARGSVSPVVPLKSIDGFTVNVPCPEIRGKLDGYRSDVKRYKVQQANECCGFLKVTQIAKEYGVPECDRHVAFEAQTVNFFDNKGIARKNLDRLLEVFEDQLAKNVPLAKQATLRLYKRTFCMQEYFRVAEEGVMKFPKDMGGGSVSFPMDFILSCASTVVSKITSTAVYCAKLYEGGYLTHYCTNADITPFRIYPKKRVKIPAAAFPAVWYDWAQQGSPQIGHNLQINGYTYPGFIPWTRRYIKQHYFGTDSMIPEADLTRYMMFCNKDRDETKQTEEYIHAPHLESLLYGMYSEEDGKQDTSTVLRGPEDVPSITVSTGEIVTKESGDKYRQIEVRMADTNNSVLRRFTGFDAADFNMLDNLMDIQMPDITEKYLSVDGNTISTDVNEEAPAYAISQMLGMGYPIIRLWGRKYVFRDLFGMLWEVEA